jgi:hypothetical protein
MTLFERGRSLLQGGDGGPEFQCRCCGARHDVQFHVCPSCSGFSVDAVKDVRNGYDHVR